MARRRYKTDALEIAYRTCRILGADKTSSFWHDRQPRRGDVPNHRSAYWDGRSGVRCSKNNGKTIQDAAYRAGQDDAKAKGATRYVTVIGRDCEPITREA